MENITPHRLRFETKCSADRSVIDQNLVKSLKFKRVTWGVLRYPPAAVCGGSIGLSQHLDEIREYKWGDVYAVNDTAGYLSEQGIECKLFAIDATRWPFKIGPNVKGAVLASRVHRKQYNLFDKKDIQVFDMLDDFPSGIEGGPTAVCRAPHLFLRMGYRQVVLFGFDSCFYDKTHIDGTHKDAFMNMLIVRVNGVDYISNAALLIQAQFLSEVIHKHPQLVINRSGGLLKAMIEHPDTWGVVAIGEDLKQQYERAGVTSWASVYKPEDNRIWQPHQTS